MEEITHDYLCCVIPCSSTLPTNYLDYPVLAFLASQQPLAGSQPVLPVKTGQAICDGDSFTAFLFPTHPSHPFVDNSWITYSTVVLFLVFPLLTLFFLGSQFTFFFFVFAFRLLARSKIRTP